MSKKVVSKFLTKNKKKPIDKAALLAFEKEGYIISLNRLKVICIVLFILSFYYFYADYAIFSRYNNIFFKRTLLGIHITGFILYTIMIVFYKRFTTFNENNKFLLQRVVLTVYIAMGLFLASLTSISAQEIDGFIINYIIVIIFIALLIPYNQLTLYILFCINHIGFIVAFSHVNKYSAYLKAGEINATATFFVSLAIMRIFYINRWREFINRRKLEISEENFRRIFDVNHFPQFITTVENPRIILVNNEGLRFYGIKREELDNVNVLDFYVDKTIREKILEKLKTDKSLKHLISEHRIRSGETRWVMANYELISYQGQECILVSSTDISELKSIEKELSIKASIDSLTGITNRTRGMELLKEKVKVCKEKNISIGLEFIDLDHLKYVNDTFGHYEGDKYINIVVGVINKFITKEDIFFRYGGDEFIVAFENKDIDWVNSKVKEIRDYFIELNKNEKNKLYEISVSIGVSYSSNSQALEVEELIEIADSNMYIQKKLKSRKTE